MSTWTFKVTGNHVMNVHLYDMVDDFVRVIMSSFFVQFIIKQLLGLVFVVSRMPVIEVSISKILEH